MGNSSYADAEEFRAAAHTGKIGIDPEAAQTALNKIRNGKDQVEALLEDTGALGATPQLGANSVGNAMATKFSDRAAGAGDSYAQALRNLYRQYTHAEEAIAAAISRYEEADQANAEPFTRVI